MDISLPGMSGIEATRRIKSELPDVRVIGLSMHGEKEHAAAMYQAGADAYLNKEGPREALVTVIREIAQAPRAE
jgi:DNA-binding NarL/FixJ family response regulator